MLGFLKKLTKNRKGAAGIEYGFLAALIAVATVVSMQALGFSLSSLYGGVADVANSAGDAGGGDAGAGNGGKGKGGKGKGKGKGKG